MLLIITRTGYLAHWHFSNMARQVFFTCLAIFLFISAKSQTTLVGWTFEDENPVADVGIAVNAGREITTNTTGAINYSENGSTSTSIYCRKWNNGQDQKYWQINLSTEGYKSLNLSSKQRSSDRGPRDFKLQYSLDELTWTDIGPAILVENNFTTGVLNNILLPSACNNQSILYIRWLVSSNADVLGTIIDPSGTSRIDDIIVTGSLIPVLTSPLTHSSCSGSPVNYFPSGSETVFNWSRSTVSGISEVANSGSGVIGEALTNTTQLPIGVNYMFNLDLNGVTNSQTVVVMVNPTPNLEVSPVSQLSCPSASIQSISFSNPNELVGTSFFWEWTGDNGDKLTVTPSNGTASPINATISNSAPATLLETSIRITATSPQGCSVNQLVTIFVGDNLPPTFTDYADTLSFCVDDIGVATPNGVDDISEPRPDFYTLIPGDHSLDLDRANFTDNCTSRDELMLHWQIDFYQNPVPVIGTGQPSLTTTSILFPGDAVNIVYHKITYWLEDECGNTTPNGQRAIVAISVHPRPYIIQDF
jgi:hypothetical protein